ncbi:MAG: amino acid permease [Planctomycetes bacterium]|nr:amino acid permease [Planctomycetota bacterium]
MNQERRELTAFDIGCVVVGGIIGVGIFFTPARVAREVDTPSQVMLAWGLGGLLAVLGGLVFAELSTLVPGHGGTFRYIQTAFGRLPAFVYGWANWLVIQAGALGVIALILVDYLNVVLFGEQRMSGDAKVLVAVITMLLFTATNVVGLRVGKRVQNTLTVLKVLAIATLVALSWGTAAAAPVEPVAPSSRSLPAMLAAAILPVLFAVGGWQQGSFLAGAARRLYDVPLGLLGGVAVVVVTYLTINLAYLDALGFAGARASQAIGADAAKVILGDVGGRVLAGMVVISAAGIMNTICLAPPYVLYAMAQQGVFPAAFGRLHPTLHTPVLGVLGQGLWGVVLLLSVHLFARSRGEASVDTLGFVCDSVVFVDWVFFAACGAAVLLLRRRAVPGSFFRVPGGAVIGALFALASLVVTGGAIVQSPIPSAVGVGLCLLGLPAYLLLMRKN